MHAKPGFLTEWQQLDYKPALTKGSTIGLKCPYGLSTRHFKKPLLTVQTVSRPVTRVFQRTTRHLAVVCAVAHIFEPVPFRKIM